MSNSFEWIYLFFIVLFLASSDIAKSSGDNNTFQGGIWSPAVYHHKDGYAGHICGELIKPPGYPPSHFLNQRISSRWFRLLSSGWLLVDRDTTCGAILSWPGDCHGPQGCGCEMEKNMEWQIGWYFTEGAFVLCGSKLGSANKENADKANEELFFYGISCMKMSCTNCTHTGVNIQKCWQLKVWLLL